MSKIIFRRSSGISSIKERDVLSAKLAQAVLAIPAVLDKYINAFLTYLLFPISHLLSLFYI